jgi:tRNA modification GTPase
MLLHGHDARDLAHAVSWLRGGASAAVAAVRAQLQDTLALLEAGLDFDDGETGAVPVSLWRATLPAIGREVAALLATVPAAARGGEALLLGRANAGKSSLANALAGRAVALVDAVAGTTRDLLRVLLPDGGVLWDAPGDLDAPGELDAPALALRDRLGGGAVGLLVVLDATAPVLPTTGLAVTLPWLAIVWTKCDDGVAPSLPATIATAHAGVPVFATSARTGFGLEPLRTFLARCAPDVVVDAGGPLRRALADALAAIERAQAAPAGPEVVAIELQAARRALDGIHGRHSPEHLLDRIYGRFCLGK